MPFGRPSQPIREIDLAAAPESSASTAIFRPKADEPSIDRSDEEPMAAQRGAAVLGIAVVHVSTHRKVGAPDLRPGVRIQRGDCALWARQVESPRVVNW